MHEINLLLLFTVLLICDHKTCLVFGFLYSACCGLYKTSFALIKSISFSSSAAVNLIFDLLLSIFPFNPIPVINFNI